MLQESRPTVTRGSTYINVGMAPCPPKSASSGSMDEAGMQYVGQKVKEIAQWCWSYAWYETGREVACSRYAERNEMTEGGWWNYEKRLA